MTTVSLWPGAKAPCKAPKTSDNQNQLQQLETYKHQQRTKRMYRHLEKRETLSKKLNFSPTFSLTSIAVSLIKFWKNSPMLRRPSSIFTSSWTLTWTRKKNKPKRKNQRAALRVHKRRERRHLKNSMPRMFIESAKMGMMAMIDMKLKVRDKGLR